MSIPDLKLSNKIAVVTGSRRGIGRAIALAFAEAGAHIAVCDCEMSDGKLENVAEEIRRFGRRCLAVKADITQKNEVSNLAQKVIEEFGTIDILVNNAAVITRGPFFELAEGDWDKVINTDLKGYYLTSQAVSKLMAEQQRKGTIINMASVAGFHANEGKGAYSVAKAGVVMLTRLLALELAHYNIRVNAIAPGMVKTDINRVLWDDPDILEKETSKIPMGRWAEPNDIADAALFLASDASSYITGHTLVVDGGLLA